MADSEPLDPNRAFAELGLIKHADSNLNDVLERITELAKQAIPGAAEVSVSLIQGDSPSTAAFTGGLALACDERQYEGNQGPCLDAARTGETVLVHDMATERRWSDYPAKASAAGVGSSMSVGLPVLQPVKAALNIYADAPRAFDDYAIGLAQSFVGYAGVALANAHLYARTSALAEQMREAMSSRAVIEQAKGILIAQRGCTPEEAFDILSRASQTSNRKLRDIAAAVVAGAQGDKK